MPSTIRIPAIVPTPKSVDAMTKTEPDTARISEPGKWDTSSHDDFYEYYKRQSLSPQTMDRFRAIAETVLRVQGAAAHGLALDVLDIGCGAGAQSQHWADQGHHYQGVDINEPLIRLARERAAEQRSSARFEVGTATALPFSDAAFDICLLPELLEHVEDWQAVVKQAMRVLRPNGVIYISTSNKLCPMQEEFDLQGYSWYPDFVKRYVVRRARTDWPAVANYARYPAVHWFSFYQLRRYFGANGYSSMDRFDIMQLENKSSLVKIIVKALRILPPLRWLGHVLTPYTVIVARRLR